MTMILCSGRFDEDAQVFIPCTNKCSQEDAPRLTPWYSSEPTEEEDAEMDRIVDEARGGKASSGSHDDDIESLKKEAAKLEWKLTGKAGIKKAVGDLLKVLQDHPNKLDLPDDEKDARTKLGPIIQMHRDKTAEEIIPLVVEELGFLADKAAEEEKKEKSAETMCKNPKNAQIVAALKELSELYFKEGKNEKNQNEKDFLSVCCIQNFFSTPPFHARRQPQRRWVIQQSSLFLERLGIRDYHRECQGS